MWWPKTSSNLPELQRKYEQSTFGAHFVEVGVDAATGEVRVRRMLAVCAAGRILNPKLARSQVIGAMTLGVGAALMEDLAVDKRKGFFVNHDLASYEVPVHSDIPNQEVIFLDDVDALSSPMKAKGVGELGMCGVGAALANAIYNATGVRVRTTPSRWTRFCRDCLRWRDGSAARERLLHVVSVGASVVGQQADSPSRPGRCNPPGGLRNSTTNSLPLSECIYTRPVVNGHRWPQGRTPNPPPSTASPRSQRDGLTARCAPPCCVR